MVAGHVVESDGKQWRMTLRPGLNFHDGTPVLAKDCVASIKRWGKRDTAGQTVLAYTDELSAPDDVTIQFKLKKPFTLLPDMLGKVGSNLCAMMPERLANTDAFTQITRDGRQRPVQVRGERAHDRQPYRLREICRLRPPRGRHAAMVVRSQARLARPRRVASHSRHRHRRGRHAEQGDGLVGGCRL